MNPATIATVAKLLFDIGKFAPVVFKTVEDAAPFARRIIELSQPGVTPARVEELRRETEADLAALDKRLETPLQPEG